jgi:hypothetical protein
VFFFLVRRTIFNIDGWKGTCVSELALANLRYNAHLLALADQTKTQELLARGRGARHKRRPWRYVGSARPCALPRRMKALLSQV